MKFTTTTFGAQIIESWCKQLVEKKVAKVRKDSYNNSKNTEDSKLYVTVYTINVLPHSWLEMAFDYDFRPAEIRFFYDTRWNNILGRNNDIGVIKITAASLDKIMKSTEIMSMIDSKKTNGNTLLASLQALIGADIKYDKD